MADERNMMNECYSCKHRRGIPGDCHSACAKPDPGMTGNPHGIRNGWFVYPGFPRDMPMIGFDPVWKTKDCANYEPRNA